MHSTKGNFFIFFSAVYPEEEVQLAPYIGLAVAFAVFTCVAAVMFLLRRRKGRDHRMYDRANSGVYYKKIFIKSKTQNYAIKTLFTS